MAVGILAYGSLISAPGSEIGPLIRKIVPVKTRFKIEFARSSSGRNAAPTLVPVDEGGACVDAFLLILDARVSVEDAEDMLYRREINKVGSGKQYPRKSNPSRDDVVIKSQPDSSRANPVLYTSIGTNIEAQDLTPEHLADLAIASAKAKAGHCGRDGITYLRDAKHAGISTPLMASYEAEILKRTGVATLDEAIESVATRRIS